jgi:mRNA-degrading endonuclease RelE of RelBE toxin-antitoxin system
MNWTLLVANPAKKDLERLPRKEQIRIERALDAMQIDPFGGDIKRLQPTGWRRRIGNYRIFYDLYIEQRRIVVTAIKRRTTSTY